MSLYIQRKYLVLGFLTFHFQTTNASTSGCPSGGGPYFPSECVCDRVYSEIICSGQADQGAEWDIKETFDNISAIVNNDTVIFGHLLLNGRSLEFPQPIAPNAIAKVKFLAVRVVGGYRFSNIDTEAFSGTYNYTKQIIITGHTFENSSQAFELFNKFKKLEGIDLGPGVFLREIPERAFSKTPDLGYLIFEDAGIERIRQFAFGGLANLTYLSFIENNITDSNIASNAFADMGRDVVMHFMEGGLTHLAEDKFKGFLDNSRRLNIGTDPPKLLDPKYFLNCDSRADWLCDSKKHRMYKQKLFGYYCREEEYTDIFEYCYLREDQEDESEEEGVTPFVSNDNDGYNQVGVISLGLALFVIIILVLTSRTLKQWRKRNTFLNLEKDFRATGQHQEAAKKYDWLPTLQYIEDYEILPQNITQDELLGKGNFGTVLSGRLKTIHWSSGNNYSKTFSPVAIKGLSPDQRSIDNLKPLCNELRVMMTIRHTLEPHPNIVGFIGALTTSFSKCDISIVMEFCENGSLKNYLTTHRQDLICTTIQNGLHSSISPEAYKWALEIANGMEFLTTNKILHIDLAARNVLLTADKTAKLSDFGSSRKLRQEKDYYRSRGDVSFHVSWTALEVLKGGSFTAQSDVWSYGVTLWEVFNLGCEPNYDPQIDIQLQLESGIRLSPPLYGDRDTKEIIADCWNLMPADRPDFTTLTDFFNLKYEETSGDLQQSYSEVETTPNGYIPHGILS